MCPFCYIGKRKFDNALSRFGQIDEIDVEWKSFQLSPDMQTSPGKSIHQFLSEHKGISVEMAKKMNDQVSEMAALVGLSYNFDIAVPANSSKAHQFLHFAKSQGKQHEAEEAVFAAYFTEGKNIDDTATLSQIGTQLGMDPDEIGAVLASGQYANDVDADVYEAHQTGIRGVPFFVFDRKYAISGAQPDDVFDETISVAYQEWKKQPVP